MRWYRKIERKLLELSVYNAYIIEGTTMDHNVPGKRKRDLQAFKLDLAHALVGTNCLRKALWDVPGQRTAKAGQHDALPVCW